jgi:hypothetical protein
MNGAKGEQQTSDNQRGTALGRGRRQKQGLGHKLIERVTRRLAGQILDSQPHQGREGKDHQSETVSPLVILRRLGALLNEDGESKWNHGEEVRYTFPIAGLAVSLRRLRYSPTGGALEICVEAWCAFPTLAASAYCWCHHSNQRTLMKLELATCWLLFALGADAALAQMLPEKKPVHKHAVVRQPLTKPVAVQARERWICIAPLLLPTIDDVVTVEIPDSMKVYTYVEQMPMLNNQKGFLAIITAINQRLVVSPSAPNGRVFVQFEVNRQGVVKHPKIVKSLRADVDSAVVVATQQLPRFTPDRQNGRVVRVSFTLPITLPVAKQP